MFNGTKFITKGIRESLPNSVQQLLWQLIESMPVSEKDYLQVFTLSTWFQLGQPKLTIHHKQECPVYSQTHVLDIDHVIHEKIFIIDDGTHCTMLLAEEY